MDINEQSKVYFAELLVNCTKIWSGVSETPPFDDLEWEQGVQALFMVALAYHIGFKTPNHPKRMKYEEALLQGAKRSNILPPSVVDLIRPMADQTINLKADLFEEMKSKVQDPVECSEAFAEFLALGCMTLQTMFGSRAALQMKEEPATYFGTRINVADMMARKKAPSWFESRVQGAPGPTKT